MLLFMLSRTKTAQTAAQKVSEAVASGAKKLLTLNAIRKAMPKAKLTTVTEYLGPLVEAMDEAGINTPARIAAFLAQVGHESGDFRYMEEIWGPTDAQKRYEPPTSLATKLGNTQAGDGRRYKGRGPIQLTGRSNYKAFTQDIGSKYGVDFVANPELVAQPRWGFKAAAWFWNTRNLNALADLGKFDDITYRINGGFNGKEDRDARYAVARAALADSAAA